MRSYPKKKVFIGWFEVFCVPRCPYWVTGKTLRDPVSETYCPSTPSSVWASRGCPGRNRQMELSVTWVTEVDGITADGTPKPFVALCSVSGTMPSPPPIAQDDISFKRLLQQGDLCNENYLGNRCKDRFLFFKIGTKNMRAKTKNRVEGNILKYFP